MRFLKKSNFWRVTTLFLGLILATNFLFDINFSIALKERLGLKSDKVKGEKQSAVSAAKIYKKLVCSCCGKSIADCTCDMAIERKAFVDEQVEKGLDEREIYKETVREYGEEILFDTALAIELKEELISEAPQDRPIISIEPESINLGEISMAKGNVEIVFKVKNIGKSDLKITGMETSCGCTSAIFRIDSKESPVFGMSDNPTDWSETLGPGEEGTLVAIFDPAHHGPEGTGSVTRTVSIKSNDTIDAFKEVQFEADVVK